MSTFDSTDLLITFANTPGHQVTAAGANFFLTTGTEDRVLGSMNVEFSFSDFSPQNIAVTSTDSGAANFLGFTVPSGTITSIRLHSVSGVYVTVDNIDAGLAAVPELPSTGIVAALFCLLVAGRAVISGVRAKRGLQPGGSKAA